jgi:hypothetical protein
METELVRKPLAEVIQLVETECIVQDVVQACTAPSDYKCPYRRARVRS